MWDSNECVCTTDYYETAAANETAAPVCTACPPESTTEGSTNSSACGKHSIISFSFLVILCCYMDFDIDITFPICYISSVVFDDWKNNGCKGSEYIRNHDKLLTNTFMSLNI